jgi:Uma2 family endonuclease
MAEQPQFSNDPLADYFALDGVPDTKAEYADGEIRMMSGASEAHIIISGNIFAAFNAQVKRPQCQAYGADMRVQVAATGAHFFPDVSLVCGTREFAERMTVATLMNPLVLVEVLSPSTESYDRITKLHHYTQIPALQDYLLVSQDRWRVERYTRQSVGWLYTTTTTSNATLALAANISLSLAAIYSGV